MDLEVLAFTMLSRWDLICLNTGIELTLNKIAIKVDIEVEICKPKKSGSLRNCNNSPQDRCSDEQNEIASS